ncbi:MAG: ATP-binding protein [Nocardioides sp.]|nr:ATP-binding protein [Nocardioides sp.]
MTKDAVQTDRAPGRSVAGWPLRRKMALALAVPLLLATIFGGLRVLGDWSDSTSAATSAKQITVLDPAVRYLTAAETAMVAAQSKGGTSQGDLSDAVDDLEAAAADLESAADSAELNGLQAAHVASLLDLSQSTRGEGAMSLGAATWIAQARQLESGVTQLISSLNAALDPPEPRLEQLSQALSGRLSLAMQQALVANADRGASASQELYSELGVEAAAIDRLAGSIEGAEAETAALRTANVRHAGQVRDGSATNLDGRDAYLPYDAITDTLLTGVDKSLNDAASSARNSALLNALITALALVGTIVLALFITKLLLDPIGRVREGALAVARQKLPDAVARIRAGEEPEEIRPIDVHTNEEIGQVARAVDDLHRQAIHLASGEAQLRQTVNAMFVTLSRRSNSLVNQQLAQIERLEQDEEDPKRLESLFRLDHLASRMRRTADSLLILADAPSRAAGSFSLTVGEALQAATSGVQDYQRVQILTHMGTRINEDAAADVVHLLTELVDNALTFSPPSEAVRLNATLSADGATITVVDSGLGVPDAELQQLNADLAHGAEASPETARRMGLFVVSRLSERHGIQARLSKNPEGGMTATVVLPPAILPELPQSGRDTKPAEPAAAPAQVVEAPEAPAAEAEQPTRRLNRAERAAVKAAEKEAAEKEAAARAETTAAPASAPRADDLLRAPEVTPDRPPLETLVPRREPGANMPRTGADAFLPPETSSATGPLFGKRSTPARSTTPASTDASAGDAAASGGGLAEGAEKVARVVPITALAARQRQQGAEEQAPVEEPAAEEPTAEEPTAEEPAAEEPAAEEPAVEAAAEEATADTPVEEPAEQDSEPRVDANDPLGLGSPAPVAEEPVAEEPVAEEPVAQEPVAPVAMAQDAEPQVDVNDPLGLGSSSPAPAEPVVPEPVVTESVVSHPVADEPVVPEPVVEEPAAAEPVVEEPAAAEATPPPLAGGLPTRTRGAAPEINRDMPGLPPSSGEASRSGGDSPIFKSMRSGWLATPGEGEWHQTEVDRGWERAEEVAEETPVVESTSAGLPRRQPGQRLVPGSVTQPTGAKTRDPEAIRRRLQAHTAGVKRGRAANSSTQHTEAGQA